MKLRHAHVKVIALAVALTAMAVPSVGASPATVQDLQPLSAAPLVDACTPPGDLEGDTRIAVNPTDPNNIVASWNGFAPGGTVVSFSRDGGHTWKQVVVPGHGGCSGAEPDSFAADPGLAFDRNGTLYVGSLNRTGNSEDERVLISRSTDGGETWEENPREVPGVATQGILANHLLWLTTDSKVSGTAYAVWTSYRTDAATAGFSQTTDGGESWSPATIIYRLLAPRRVDARGHMLRVLKDGSLLDVFAQNEDPDDPASRWEIKAIHCVDACEDGEVSWSAPVQIGAACNNVPRDPDTGIAASIFGEPSLDVAPDGTAYAAWHTIGNCAGQSTSRLLLATSTDGGTSWSEPQDVKSEVENICPDGFDHPDQAHLPTLAVAPDGTVGVTYYDFRNDCPGDGELTTDVWFSHSHDGGASWDVDHVAGPFDMRSLFDPFSNAFGVTDFNGLAGLSSGFSASFVQSLPAAGADCLHQGCTTEPPTDVFFAHLELVPQPDLQVTDMTAANNKKVREGDKVTITATVSNTGGADAAASKTKFVLDDSTVLGTIDTLAIPSGGSTEVSVTWDTRGVKGEHTISATADAEGTVPESDEGNNVGVLPVTVQGNKVKNGSFEQANDAGTGPDGWTGVSTDAGEASWTEGGSDGAMSASVSGTEGSALLSGSPAWTSDPIAVAAGETLTLRVSVDSTGASSAPTAGLVYLDALGQVIGAATLITAPLDTEGFVMLESAVAVPAGVVEVQVVLTGFSPLDQSTAGTVTLDDVGLFGE